MVIHSFQNYSLFFPLPFISQNNFHKPTHSNSSLWRILQLTGMSVQFSIRRQRGTGYGSHTNAGLGEREERGRHIESIDWPSKVQQPPVQCQHQPQVKLEPAVLCMSWRQRRACYLALVHTVGAGGFPRKRVPGHSPSILGCDQIFLLLSSQFWGKHWYSLQTLL